MLMRPENRNFQKRLKEIGLSILVDFNKKLQDYRRTFLAAMAESLVNLTSFKRKISLDAEPSEDLLMLQ